MVWRFMAVAVAVLGAHFVSAEQGAAPVVPLAQADGLAELESLAATQATPRELSALALAYLERGQPGLATASIEHAPAATQAEPMVATVYASALLRRGLPSDALRVARGAQDTCSDDLSCPAWMRAKTRRQVAFLDEVVRAGVVDPEREPAAMMAAYERSAREVGLVAMR